jgi:hypothetical protein
MRVPKHAVPRLSRIAISVSLCAACAIPVASYTHAARPLTTDDARIVDPKACQIESWMRRNQGSTEYWSLPACNPTGNLELTFGGAMTYELGERHTSDVQIQGKTIFRKLEPNSWGFGLALGSLRHPGIQPPRDFAANLYGYVPVSVSFADDRYVVHTNVGALRAEGESQHRFTWGVGAEIPLHARLLLVSEVFSQTARGPQYQVGLRYWLVPDRVQVDATLGDHIGHSRDERFFSFGLRLLSPAFLL